MTIADLFVISKPSEATDSMGGDFPWQSYSYVCGERSYGCELTSALVFTSEKDAEAFHKAHVAPIKRGYRVVTLKTAHEYDKAAAVDRARYEPEPDPDEKCEVCDKRNCRKH